MIRSKRGIASSLLMVLVYLFLYAPLLVMIVFSTVIFGSTLFIVTHAAHDCTGEDCAVCTELSECSRTVNTLGSVVSGALVLALLVFAAAETAESRAAAGFVRTTLISLKVELLN